LHTSFCVFLSGISHRFRLNFDVRFLPWVRCNKIRFNFYEMFLYHITFPVTLNLGLFFYILHLNWIVCHKKRREYLFIDWSFYWLFVHKLSTSLHRFTFGKEALQLFLITIYFSVNIKTSYETLHIFHWQVHSKI
jgi:hypothetical protein